jgi:hypothetical protein
MDIKMTNMPEAISDKISSYIYRGWGTPCKYYYGFVYDSRILDENNMKPVILLVYQTYKYVGVSGAPSLLFYTKEVKCRLAYIEVNGKSVENHRRFNIGSVSCLEKINDLILDELDGSLMGRIDLDKLKKMTLEGHYNFI